MYYLKLGRRILSALTVFCGSFAFAADYYVSTTGLDENDGSSAETAVATIDKAIGLATSKDDTIHVAPGTYQTTTQYGPKLTATMEGMGTSRDEVVIESAGTYRTLRMAADSVVRHLTLVGNKDYKADKGGAVEMSGGLLEDCVIKDGTASNSSNTEGGNVYLNGGTVRNCVITGGKAKRFGGNVYVEKGTVENCEIREGTIESAGGSPKGANAVIKGTGKISRCKLMGGECTSYNAASLYIGSSSAAAEDCLVTESSCGGVLMEYSSKLYNSTIVKNKKYGMWAWSGSICLYNTVFYGNVDNNGAGRDWSGNRPAEGLVSGLAVMTEGSRFTDYKSVIHLDDALAFVDYANGDYHLAKDSVLVDVGVTEPRTDASETDLDGKPRVVNRVDIGCYEYQPVEFSVSFSMSYGNDHIPAVTTFVAVPLNAAGSVTYTWDFGDGSERVTTTEATVTHTFVKAGKFTVTLTAESAGETATQTREELAVIYDTFVWVSPTGTAIAPYNTEATALRAIDSALSVHASAGGGEIRVAPGTYETAWQYNLDKDYVVRGMGESPEEVVVKNTTKADKSNTYRRVFQVASEGARVENLTMEGGSVYNQFGGNLRITAGTVANCIIRGGLATADNGNAAGGGVELGGSGVVTHCVIRDNVLTGVSNSEMYCGGAGVFMTQNNKKMRLSNCLIVGNTYQPGETVQTGAAGIRFGGSNEQVVMENCTVVANKVEGTLKDDSAGVYCTSWTTTIRNCVFAGNAETGKDKATSVKFDPNMNILNCVMDDVAFNKYCTVGDVKTMFKDFENGDYTPKPGSVLANTGTSKLTLPTDKDLAGNPRVFDSKIDIGCYEVQKRSAFILIIR